MSAPKNACICITASAALLIASAAAAAETAIDLSDYRSDCDVRVQGWDGHLKVTWPAGEGEMSEVTLDLSGERPLIEKMAARKDGAEAAVILTGVDPVWFLTVGERRAADEKGPDQQWEVFFDNPAKRPHATFASKLAFKSAKVSGSGKRAT